MSKKQEKRKRTDAATKQYFNPRVRQEVWDADYVHTLPPAEKAWYLKFMSEYANASLELVKDPLIEEYAKENNLMYKRAKTEMKGGGYTPIKSEGKPKKGHIHKTKAQAKSIFDANNNRNNDLLGVTKINGLLEGDIHDLANKKDIWIESNPQSTEDAIIELIDLKKSKKKDS